MAHCYRCGSWVLDEGELCSSCKKDENKKSYKCPECGYKLDYEGQSCPKCEERWNEKRYGYRCEADEMYDET